jgi:hypothetical protein
MNSASDLYHLTATVYQGTDSNVYNLRNYVLSKYDITVYSIHQSTGRGNNRLTKDLFPLFLPLQKDVKGAQV